MPTGTSLDPPLEQQMAGDMQLRVKELNEIGYGKAEAEDHVIEWLYNDYKPYVNKITFRLLTRKIVENIYDEMD